MNYGRSRSDEEESLDLGGLALDWDSSDRDEVWLISYADIISTVLAMVVLLFGRNALNQVIPEAHAATAPVAALAPAFDALQILPEPERVPALPQLLPEPEAVENAPSREQLLASVIASRFDDRIRAEARSEGLVLTIPEVALFASARAVLQNNARPLLDELAATLAQAGDVVIAVEGHTDNVPVTGGMFASNWDLAAARANAVTRYVLERGFEPQRLHSVAYAETKPVANNSTPEGRAANRRVELKVEFVTAAD